MRRQKSLWNDNRIHIFLAISFLLLIIIPILNKTPSLQVSEQSQQAAVDFLNLVDDEEYAESWTVAAASLQNMLTQEAWTEQIGEMRSAIGKVIERTPEEIAYADPAGDMPAGEYVVITFTSKYQFKEYVTERVTLWLDESGRWQVAGYFLR